MSSGQRTPFSQARIAVVGTGGTGCALLPLVGAMPVTTVAVIDGDTVEAVNLPRQLLFGAADVGRAKVQVAVEQMRAKSPSVIWVPEFRFIDAANVDTLLADHDVVADCTDDLAARALIDQHCRSAEIPLVSGAVHGHQVQVVTVHGAGRSFFQGRTTEDQMGCDMRSVPAAVTTLTASLMALRIADLLAGGDGLAGIMDLVDSARGRWMRLMGSEASELMDVPTRPGHHA